MSYSRADARPEAGRGRGQPQDARRPRRARPRGVSTFYRPSPGGRGGLSESSTADQDSTGAPEAPFLLAITRMHALSIDDHKQRQREAEAGAKARRAQAPRARGPVRHRGRRPAGSRSLRRATSRSLLLTREGEGVGGDEVAAELLDAVSTLGSGTRAIAIWPLPEAKRPTTCPYRGTSVGRLPGEGALCVYLHGVGDPGNVGSIVRSAGALADAWVALGPECADPYGPKAVRASMGAIFTVPISALRPRGDACALASPWLPTEALRSPHADARDHLPRLRARRPARRRSSTRPTQRGPFRCAPTPSSPWASRPRRPSL